MKHLFFSSLVILMASCSQSKFNEDDFANKTFSSQIILDSTITSGKDNMAAGMMLAFMNNTKLSFAFKKPPEGIYTASIGAMVSEKPFQWAIKNDTIKIVMVNEGKGKTTAYKVVNADNGYTLHADSASLRLTIVSTPK